MNPRIKAVRLQGINPYGSAFSISYIEAIEIRSLLSKVSLINSSTAFFKSEIYECDVSQ